MVKDIIIEDNQVKGIITDKDETYTAAEVISAVGREGADWFSHICNQHDIETKVGTVDIGVRVEVRDEVMEFLNENLYEAKLVYHTPTFDDKVRTFCTNPSGEVATEYYDNGLAVVNGHAYKSKDSHSSPICSVTAGFWCRHSETLSVAEERRRSACAVTTSSRP